MGCFPRCPRAGKARSQRHFTLNHKENDNMTSEKPVHEIRLGRIKVSLWANRSENGFLQCDGLPPVSRWGRLEDLR